MTIRTTSRTAGPFAAGATSLPFAFKVYSPTDMRVTRSDAAGNTTTLVYGVNYTVTLNADQENSPGGRINLYVAIPFGYTDSVTTAMPALQTLALTNQGGFSPSAINDAFDKVVILIQQQTGGSGGGGGGGGGGGDITDGANIGTGAGVFSTKSGSALLFKSLRAGANVTLTPGASDITISAAGGSGSATTASNVGAGVGVFRSKTGDDLAFKSIKAGVGVTITGGADDITIAATGGGGGTTQFLSVKDFGAVGDGTTSDVTAFSNALDACRAQKKALLVPDGTYLIDGLAAQSGRVFLWGVGRAVLKGQFHYHEPSFPVSASTLTPLTPDSPFFSAQNICFQGTTDAWALWLSSVWQGSFITTFSLKGCKFYGRNGLLLQHMGGFDMHDCEFNNVLVGAQYEGCVNGNMLQCRWQNQATAGVRIRRNDAQPTRKGGENMRFTNCEFDVCSFGMIVEEHQWLIVESCLLDYCALPMYLMGSWYAKIEKSYVGVSNVPRSTFASVPGAVFPDANGIALYGLCNPSEGQPVSVTAVNCEFVNYIAGTTQPIVYINGYGNAGQPQMGYETTFAENLFYMPEVHSAPRLLDVAYCRVARVVNNRFSSVDRGTAQQDAYSTANCADYMNFGNSFILNTQGGVSVGSKYEKAVGIRQDANDPGPIGADGAWSQNGTGPIQIRNKTNTGWNTPGGGGGGGSTKVKIVVAGASHTARQGILSPAWPSIFADNINSSGASVEVINVAKNGWSYYNANTVAMFGTATMRDKIIALAPDILHVHLGFNDALMRVNPRTLAQLQSDAANFYNTIRAALPNCKIFYGSEVSHDVAHDSGGTIYNKQVMPIWFQLKTSGILAGLYTSEILEDAVSSTTQTNISDWKTLTAYIKGLASVTSYYDVPLWKITRLGCLSYDNIHFTAFGTQLIAGAVRMAYKNNATMAAALPNLSNQDYDSFNDPNNLFSLTFTDTAGNWVEGAAYPLRDHPTHQAGPYRSTPCSAWHLPSKGAFIYNKNTVSQNASDMFAWHLYNVMPNKDIQVSVDGGAFASIGLTTDQQGKYLGVGSLAQYAVGNRVFRYKVENEVHGPVTVTITAGSPAPAAPELYRSSGSPSSYNIPVGNTKYYFRPASTQDNTGSMVTDVTASSQRRVEVAASATARVVTLEASLVIDLIGNTSTHLLLGFDVFDTSNNLLQSYLVDSRYCNVANQSVTVNGSYTLPHTAARRYAPWILTAGGVGTMLGTTPNGTTAMFNVAIK